MHPAQTAWRTSSRSIQSRSSRGASAWRAGRSSTGRASRPWTGWRAGISARQDPRSRTRSWPGRIRARSRRFCSSIRSKACTPTPNMAATAVWPDGVISASLGTSSREAIRLARLRPPTAAIRWPPPASWQTSLSSSACCELAKAVAIGCGAGGSVAAMELARAGWEVVVFEKGPNRFTNIDGEGPMGTPFSNDDLKMNVRYFAGPDPLVFPRTWRPDAATPVQHTGAVNELPQLVGGGTVHWDAKVPRFWDIDFQQLSALGPVPGADLADWPFSYADIAPYYDEVETLIGVQGDVSTMPGLMLRHTPRGPFPMPPGPQQRSSLVVAAGATAIGMHPFAYPMAINSVPYNGQHVCNDCGFCSGYGCPVVARPAALMPLRAALRTGRVSLVPETMVTSVQLAGSSATGVRWVRMTSSGPVTGG